MTIEINIILFVALIITTICSVALAIFTLVVSTLCGVPLELKKTLFKRKMIYVYSNNKELYSLPYSAKNREKAISDVAHRKNAKIKIVKERYK